MNAFVCNTLNGAVSEYTRHEFQSVTPTHGGAATGLYAFGGDTDAGLPIVATIKLPATLRENTLKKVLGAIYVSVAGEGSMALTVFGKAENWTYSFPLRPSGQTRADVGRGIRENYLGFGLSNPSGQAFTLDRIEAQQLQSQSRRI